MRFNFYPLHIIHFYNFRLIYLKVEVLEERPVTRLSFDLNLHHNLKHLDCDMLYPLNNTKVFKQLI